MPGPSRGWVRVSPHAFRRARERFPSLRAASRARLNSMLVAIALRGEPFGESVLVHHSYRRGVVHPDTPLIVALAHDQDGGNLVITTVLTEEEARNAGPFRPTDR